MNRTFQIPFDRDTKSMEKQHIERLKPIYKKDKDGT
jgi:hypothetical protein